MRDTVVVGGSAGSVRALRELVHGIPADLPAAVLAVVHIPAYSNSALPLLLRGGPLPARAAEDGEPIARGNIYVAPPDRHLLVERGRLRLTRGPRENRVRPCIDVLFRSAAVELGPRVVGVVLSGALDDGTAGLWAVKDRGGIAIVQQPTEAEFPDMPRNALAHVDVDHVLPAAEIGAKLAALSVDATHTAPRAPPAMAAEAAIAGGTSTRNEAVLELGPLSPNTCPECHGTLTEIREGSIVRYRCHAGHAYSVRTLLAETEIAIEKSLWNAVRAIEERSFLLRTMERRLRASGDDRLADRYAAEAKHDEGNARLVRGLTSGPPAESSNFVAR